MSNAFGCLTHLALVGLATWAIDRFTGPAVQAEFRPWVALFAAALLVLGASNVWHLLRGYGRGDASRDALLARARTGEPPVDGGPMLVTGLARTDGPPLRGPLTGRECIAYQYRMYRKIRTDSKHGTRIEPIWWGMASRPFVIDTGTRAVRVAAMPELIDVPARDKTDDVIARARHYIHGTTFEDGSGLDLLSSAATMVGALIAEQSAGTRHDWHRRGSQLEPADLLLEEIAIDQGATVSAAGHWSPERRALVPEGGLGGAPVTLTTGAPRRLLARASVVPHSARSVAICAVVLMVIGVAVVWLSAQGYMTRW